MDNVAFKYSRKYQVTLSELLNYYHSYLKFNLINYFCVSHQGCLCSTITERSNPLFSYQTFTSSYSSFYRIWTCLSKSTQLLYQQEKQGFSPREDNVVFQCMCTRPRSNIIETVIYGCYIAHCHILIYGNRLLAYWEKNNLKLKENFERKV